MFTFGAFALLIFLIGRVNCEQFCTKTCVSCGENAEILGKVSNGRIRGTLMHSRNGRPFYAFRGVPYAKPPIGDLRFKAPEPANDWEGIYNATDDPPVCLQKNYAFFPSPEVEGLEDCLYLNVYTPVKANEEASNKKLPVMFLIHYGAFVGGSSKSTLFGPQYLLDKDIVLVSINYRLGIFGFYTTLDDASPGNYGLKDQVLALKWVQKNIENFNGDPKLVTIFGWSAGGGSVHHHILSPSSQGLFHRAIASSGTALDVWAHPLNELQTSIFRPTAQIAGCNPNATTNEIVKCLRKVDAKNLILVSDAFKYFSVEPLITFTMVTEVKSESNPNPFLTEHPLEIIKKGNFSKVPLIIGVAQDEGILRTSPLVRQEAAYKRLVEEFDYLVPEILFLKASTLPGDTKKVWETLREFYFQNEVIDVNKPNTIQGFTDLYSDRIFVYGAYQSALYHAYKGYKNLWMYNFAYRGQLSYGDIFAGTNRSVDINWGVSHCDEAIYLFETPEYFPELPAQDRKMSEIMVDIWTHFATHGHPPKVSESCTPLDWKKIPNHKNKLPIKNEYLQFLNITNSEGVCPVSMKMQNGFLKERMQVWTNLPIFHQIEGMM